MPLRSLIPLIVLGVAACGARAEVALPVDMPALRPPTPPARLIIPETEPETLPEPEAPAPPPATPSRPSAARPTPPPSVPVPTPPPAQTEAAPAVLSTSMNTADFERRIRIQLGRATSELAQVNRGTLSAEARAQYDAAQGFVRQCEEALKVRNLVFAGQLADKAAAMAARLLR